MDWVVAAAMMGVTVVGGVVASVCGFGFGAVAMATWPYFLPYQQAVAVSALCGLSTALMIAVPHHRSINFKILLPCSLVALCCSAASVQLSLGAAEKLMIHALGAMLNRYRGGGCAGDVWSSRPDPGAGLRDRAAHPDEVPGSGS